MNDSVDIRRADAFELLASLDDASVDLIATDPAYNGMNQHLSYGSGRIVGKYDERGDGQKWFSEFDDTPENYARFLDEIKRVLGPDKPLFLMFDPYSMLTLAPLVRERFDVKNVITWDKVAIGMGHHFRRRSEFILYATTGKCKLNRRDVPDVWPIKRLFRAQYPTQKPIELFEAMIAATVVKWPDALVCDPFLGSGSSAIAALRQGCRFVGSDISEASLDATRLRLHALHAGEPDPLQPKPAELGAGLKPYWIESRVLGLDA